MQKLTYAAAKQKFIDQGRVDIELLEKGYVRWKDKAVFLDCTLGEEFMAIPSNVYAQKSFHPKRSMEKRKQTCLEVYGNACSLHGTTEKGLQVRKQVEETCKKKSMMPVSGCLRNPSDQEIPKGKTT